MAQLLEEQRETWGTRGGFILAAVGSAVGLGNLWGFPYKIYSYGGGAFLIPYIIAMFCIGVPLLILEFSLGHFTQRAAPSAFRRTNRKLEFVGWWGIILGFVIITYYPTVLAYCFSFMWFSLKSIATGEALPWAGKGLEGVKNAQSFFYDEYLAFTEGNALGSIRWNIVLPLILAWTAMYLAIFKGVKLVGKIVWLTVPLPWLMLIVLTVRGMTLEGSMKGLVYYLDPVWGELAKPTTWRFAFGQVFFSLSLAFGVMITYSSFLHRKSDLNNNAAIIGLADFATSFIAGLAIFSTLGGMAHLTHVAGDPVTVDKVVSGGPGLAFIAFPYALAQLPGAAWWSLIFFFTLVTLGIDSAFSITESVLAGIVDKTGWKRSIVLPVMSLIGLLFGLVFVTNGGLNWLGTMDGFINGTWGIAFLGLLECIVLGWIYKTENLRSHANERSDWNLGKWWNFSIRIVIPLILGTLFFWSLYDDITQKGGFLKAPDGNWILPNCVGMTVMAFAPLLAIFMSSVKNPDEKNKNKENIIPDYNGSKKGAVSLILVLFSIFLVIVNYIFGARMPAATGKILTYTALGLSFAAMIISCYVVEKFADTPKGPTWYSRWSGMIATLNISFFLSMFLVSITKAKRDIETVYHTHEELSIISYVILSVVLLVIILGLGWCFYRAITAAAMESPVQYPDN